MVWFRANIINFVNVYDVVPKMPFRWMLFIKHCGVVVKMYFNKGEDAQERHSLKNYTENIQNIYSEYII